jgi:MFS family permease
LPLLRGPFSHRHDQSSRREWRILRRPLFWLIAFASFFQGLAYNIPFVYLPCMSSPSVAPSETRLTDPSEAYALNLQIPSTKATLLLTAMNLASTIGQIMSGFASDRMSVYIPLVISSVCTTVAVCTFWLLGTHFSHLVTFAVVYGFFAGGFNVLYARLATVLSNSNASAALWVYGLLAFDRGLGYVISGPVSGAIVGGSFPEDGDKSTYRYLILFDGIAFGLSACGGIGWLLKGGEKGQAAADCEADLGAGAATMPVTQTRAPRKSFKGESCV